MNKSIFSALVLLVLALQPVGLQAAMPGESIGQVTESRGVAIAYSNTGERRRLERGSHLYQGETLITGKGALSKMRFQDGAFFMLGENTQFRVEDYEASDSSQNSRSFYRLLKGGFRFLSGLIGKSKPDNFQIRTSVATIGIRGSGGQVQLDENGLQVHTEKGALTATNNRGQTTRIEAGQSLQQSDGNAPMNEPQNGKPDSMNQDQNLVQEDLQGSADEANQQLGSAKGPGATDQEQSDSSESEDSGERSEQVGAANSSTSGGASAKEVSSPTEP